MSESKKIDTAAVEKEQQAKVELELNDLAEELSEQDMAQVNGGRRRRPMS